MKRPATLICSITAALVAAATTLPAAAQFVTVGDPGNPPDQEYYASGYGYGAVATTYAIGTYEVTLDQYTAFLNAVAATDTYDLYHPYMASDPLGAGIAGIAQSGSSGSYTYSVIGNGQRPVTYVSFYDAMRYANWLGTGSTETGAYTLLGGTPVTVTRNGGAQFWIPSTDEWYKAAYYQPAAAGGDTDGYWLYPMQTNDVPYSADPFFGTPPDNTRVGNFWKNDGVANGYDDGYAVSTGNTSLTPVGAYILSDSYYGTFDQGGNVWEWTDEMAYGSARLWGGSWDSGMFALQATNTAGIGAGWEDYEVGFRIATVPEPTVSVSLMLAGGLFLARRKRPGAR